MVCSARGLPLRPPRRPRVARHRRRNAAGYDQRAASTHLDQGNSPRPPAPTKPPDRTTRGAQPAYSANAGVVMKPATYQETVFSLKRYWSDRGCIIQEPYDMEAGAGTMPPEPFRRLLGPRPYP